jgi:hypothetical protein
MVISWHLRGGGEGATKSLPGERVPAGDMNLGPHEYETRVLITRPRRYCRPTIQHLQNELLVLSLNET